MDCRNVTGLYFSPSGTTKLIVEKIAFGLAEKIGCGLPEFVKGSEPRDFHGGETLVVGVPVFAGRVPQVYADAIRRFNGNGAMAVAVVVYGNREYDDALVELSDILNENGFHVAAAGAFVARHSIFPDVASGRPDEKDMDFIAGFAERCATVLKSYDGNKVADLHIKGNRPYREASTVPLKPTGDRKCILCGACAAVCPVHAIDRDHPKKTNKELCISCTACISVCPTGARRFRGLVYRIADKKFAKKFSARKEPEVFF